MATFLFFKIYARFKVANVQYEEANWLLYFNIAGTDKT